MGVGGCGGKERKKYGDNISQLFILIWDPGYLGLKTGNQ